MKIFFALILLLATSAGAFSQYEPSRVNRKATDAYTKALQTASEGRYPEALAMLGNAVRLQENYLDAYLSIGGIYAEMKNYAQAVKNYEIAKAIDSNYFKDYSLPYAINLAGLGRFDEALKAVEAFLSIPGLRTSSRQAGEYRKACFQFALDYAKTHLASGYKFEPKNLGDSVNSAVSEYFPALTIDGSQLLYTRRVNNTNEDFYSALRDKERWHKSSGLAGSINTGSNEGAQNISQDGQWLIFTGCNFPDGFGSCDLYISYLTRDGWSKAQNLGEVINTESWESAPSLSPDKRDLYFASNREGGFGKSDIYVSHLQADGRWSAPENAGPSINTAGNESCPFIHADNQTLYFTSDGHRGYGGDDLFFSRKVAGSWSMAENLGYPINTIENEGSLIVAADGKTAYYASDRSDSRGGLDLYSFQLREEARPAKTLWVKGRVSDAVTRKGLPSAVELTDLSSGTILSKVQTDETGNYLITLPEGKDYAFNVNRKGYLFFSENFPLSRNSADSTYAIDISLQPLKTNASVVLKNIFFDINKYSLKEESFPELKNIVRLLKENPGLKISINGHTDNTGKAADNIKLSNDRAKAVVNYLVKQGINPSGLTAKGFGSTEPLADNSTESGRAKNRRTEMKVLN